MISTILDDINKLLDSIESKVEERGTLAHDILLYGGRSYGYLVDDNSRYENVFYALQALDRSLMPLFWDISIQISREYVRETINREISSSLQINHGGYWVKLTKISTLSCEIRGNSIRAQAKWRLEISSSNHPSEFYIQLKYQAIFRRTAYPDSCGA